MAAHPPEHPRISGTFGAAAAAGCAAGLNAQQMRWLLDYAAQQASGMARGSAIPSTSKRLSTSPGCPRATASPPRCWFRRALPGVDDVFSGADNFFSPSIPRQRRRNAHRQARRALRNHAHQHQEVDRGLAHSGAARRAGKHSEEANIILTRTQVKKVVVRVATDEAAIVEQPRNAGHLPAAHDRGDAARQNGDRSGPRMTRRA